MSDETNDRSQGLDELLVGLLAGDQRALARALTVVESDEPDAEAILQLIEPRLSAAMIVGVTGPPGVGKSTLIDAFVAEFRKRKMKVGVLAVDPSSPVTGGAILGDRIRMARHVDDPGVFIRSIASRGQLGGLSRTAERVLEVMKAAGPDVLVVETVGAGQSDVTIASIAHVNIVVSAPGLGDGVQAIKAGILEIADILVVNKSDQPQAEQTVVDLNAMLKLRPRDLPPVSVVPTTATSGAGISTLVKEVEAKFARKKHPMESERRVHQIRRAIGQRAAELLERYVDGRGDAQITLLCDCVRRGELSIQSAAERLLRGIISTDPND